MDLKKLTQKQLLNLIKAVGGRLCIEAKKLITKKEKK